MSVDSMIHLEDLIEVKLPRMSPPSNTIVIFKLSISINSKFSPQKTFIVKLHERKIFRNSLFTTHIHVVSF